MGKEVEEAQDGGCLDVASQVVGLKRLDDSQQDLRFNKDERRGDRACATHLARPRCASMTAEEGHALLTLGVRRVEKDLGCDEMDLEVQSVGWIAGLKDPGKDQESWD